MIGLTARQAECLAFIEARIAERGIAPTFPDMIEGLGYAASSKRTIHQLLTALEERGRIRRLPNRARAIEVIQPAIAPRFRGVPLKFIPIHELAADARRRR